MHINHKIQYWHCTDMGNFFRTTQLPLLRRRTTRLRRRRTTSLPRTPTSSRLKVFHKLCNFLLFTNFSPTLVVVLIQPKSESGMWRKVKNIKNHWGWIECGLTWVSYPGGAGDPVWAHPGLQLSRHQGRHLLYLHINSTNYLNKVSSQHLPTYTSRPLSNTIHLHIGSTIRASWT